MKIDNLYNSLSKFSLSSIINKYLLDISPEQVFIAKQPYLIQPLGIHDGINFYYNISSNLFEYVWIDFFKNPAKTTILNNSLSNHSLVDSLFHLIHDIYNFESDDLYDLLQQSNMKEIKYLIYVIKKQNFMIYDHMKAEVNYNSLTEVIDQMDKLFDEYKNLQQTNVSKHALLDVKAIEYSAFNVKNASSDYILNFYKDYIIGNEGFYSILINGYLHKFLSICDKIPAFIQNTNPVYWCRLNNDRCIQSCKLFDPSCNKRYIKKFSYLPFKAIFILPQMVSLMKDQDRELDLDTFIRSTLYALSASFGEKSQLKQYISLDHNAQIRNIMDRNKIHIVKNLFENFRPEEIDSEIRSTIGLKDSTVSGVERGIEILRKMSEFIDKNKESFLTDETKIQIFNDFINLDVKPFLTENENHTLSIFSSQDFTTYISGILNEIINIDNMLMSFPNDLKNLDKMANDMLKMIKGTKETLSKMGGGRTPIDPRETLLTSESLLFRRIAVDNNLFEFYRDNNRTRLINSILFQKWTLAWSFIGAFVLQLNDDHPILTMKFNEIE